MSPVLPTERIAHSASAGEPIALREFDLAYVSSGSQPGVSRRRLAAHIGQGSDMSITASAVLMWLDRLEARAGGRGERRCDRSHGSGAYKSPSVSCTLGIQSRFTPRPASRTCVALQAGNPVILPPDGCSIFIDKGRECGCARPPMPVRLFRFASPATPRLCAEQQ